MKESPPNLEKGVKGGRNFLEVVYTGFHLLLNLSALEWVDGNLLVLTGLLPLIDSKLYVTWGAAISIAGLIIIGIRAKTTQGVITSLLTKQCSQAIRVSSVALVFN